jgi:L-ascorbate metabolism protein UlaG (beta-lactamase superfamily)
MPTAASQQFEEPVFLKQEVKMEPLACGWYAWPHLVAPMQLALNIKFRYLPLMQSFISNPSVHAAAASDPNLFGGPFVTLTDSAVPAVKDLFNATLDRCSSLITLAQDWRDLDTLLQDKANGYSLNEFYGKLPESLQGIIECVYDINNHPALRVFEELLHQDDISAHTQEIYLAPISERDRCFFMNTPRLRTPDSLTLRMKFSDRRLDALAATRTTPRSCNELASLFGLQGADKETFRRLFTTTPPKAAGNRDHAGDDVRVRYFGHACVLIQTSRTSILFDPMVAMEQHDDGRLTLNDLPDFIDYVVLTHCHQDHFCPEMLLQLRHRIGRIIVPRNNGGAICDPSMKLVLEQLGYERIDVMDPMDNIAVPDGEILSMPFAGEHCDLNIYTKHTIALTLKGRKFLFLIDSDGWDPVLYRRMMRRIQSVDAVFLGMECDGAPLNWLYEPLLTKPVNRRNNESRRLSGADCERAWNVWKEIKAPRVFVYAMGQEPWMRHIMGLEYEPDSIQLQESDKFVERVKQAGAQAERLYNSRELTF